VCAENTVVSWKKLDNNILVGYNKDSEEEVRGTIEELIEQE